jgi:hypothetical protein
MEKIKILCELSVSSEQRERAVNYNEQKIQIADN